MTDLEKWLERTAGARKAACAAELRRVRAAAKREAVAAQRREAFRAARPNLRPEDGYKPDSQHQICF